MKRYSAQQLRNFPSSALVHICKEQQKENLKLMRQRNALIRKYQGYLLGISQLKEHIARVLERTQDIDNMEIGVEL